MIKSLTEEVCEKLRDDIVGLRMAPGAKVSEAKQAERYQVSRAPVRSAIERLRLEGLVVVKPQVGTIISPLSFEGALEVLGVRRLLEPAAAETAAARRTDADARALREAGGAGLAGAVHEVIRARCGNAEMARLLRAHQGVVERVLRAAAADAQPPRPVELEAVAEALIRRDPAAARRATGEYLAALARHIRGLAPAREPA